MFGGAGGKQWASGGAGGNPEVKNQAKTLMMILSNVPGSIPGSCFHRYHKLYINSSNLERGGGGGGGGCMKLLVFHCI